MPSDMARDGPPFVACDFCGKPADHQPLSQVADGRRMGQLHRRCEDPWLHMSGGNGAPQSDLDGDKASGQPDAIILIRQIRVPAISAVDDICALPVADLATDDAVLFLWTTASHLQESWSVIQAWGFQYVSNIVWLKDKLGLGYWVRNQHEVLLICRRGDMPTPLPTNRPSSVIISPRREHSRKPDEAYELIERMYPELPRIELFARQARSGWDAWGNEVETAA
jgi:N6-adenosine-specific RNA methylase IME4